MYEDQLIKNDFFNYNFEGYEIRSDQVIDFGKGLNAESLIFTVYKGVDWMEATHSHYFQIKHQKVDQTFEEVVNGPSWFTHFHDEILEKREEYFYTSMGYPAYLIISWKKNPKNIGDFFNYYYSLLIDGTTEDYEHLDIQPNLFYSRPWLEVWMQSLVGVGSNLPLETKLSEITQMIKEVAGKIEIKGGNPSSRVDQSDFDLLASNSSPFSFIKSTSLGNQWEVSEWFGSFYKSLPNWIFHEHLGWFYYGKSTEKSSWCWNSIFQWFWISHDTYPYVFLENGRWLYIDPTSSIDSVNVYDFVQNDWTQLSMLGRDDPVSFQDQIFAILSSFMTEEEKSRKVGRLLLQN